MDKKFDILKKSKSMLKVLRLKGKSKEYLSALIKSGKDKEDRKINIELITSLTEMENHLDVLRLSELNFRDLSKVYLKDPEYYTKKMAQLKIVLSKKLKNGYATKELKIIQKEAVDALTEQNREKFSIVHKKAIKQSRKDDKKIIKQCKLAADKLHKKNEKVYKALIDLIDKLE